MQLDNEEFKRKLNNVIKNSNYELKNKPSYNEIPEIT
jgi:hypothetical protein